MLSLIGGVKMRKNISVKRFLAFVIALLNLLTIMPVAVSADDVIPPTAYNAYVSGNFVQGQTLTANYEYVGTYPEDTDETVITWYAQNRYASTSGGHLKTLGTGRTYTVPSDYTTSGNVFAIYFRVTPKDTEGNTGAITVSNIGTNIKAASTTLAPKATAMTIRPTNAAGTMHVGDTVAARYSYYEVTGTAEGESKFAWYTRENLSAERVLVQEESTEKTYTIKDEDYGKWLEVDITPVNADGEVGTTVTAKNHVSNFAFERAASATHSGASRGTGYFDVAELMADINRPYTSSANNAVGYLYAESGTKNITVTEDLGSVKSFDAIFLGYSIMSGGALNSFSLSYYNSTNNNDAMTDDSKWVTIDLSTARLYQGTNEYEYVLDGLLKSRYVRFKASMKAPAAVWDFFPFTTKNALPDFDLEGEEEAYVLLGEDYVEPGYIITDATGEDITDECVLNEWITVDFGGLDTDVMGEYTITYTLAIPGMPQIIRTRKAIVDLGAKTIGDYAYGATVTSENAGGVNSVGTSHLVDGNYNTLWETTELPASAVIDLGEETYISYFELDEAGDNIQAFNIYTSNDGEDWDLAYEGTTAGAEFGSLFTPVKARFVKLEITEALEATLPAIKDMEIHISNEDKVAIAIEDLEKTIEELVKEQEHLKGYVYADLELPSRGTYNTEISWLSSNPDIVTNSGRVQRTENDKEITLFATVAVVEDEVPVAYDEVPIVITVSKIGTPQAIDVHIDGNIVYGQEGTIDFTYYDESGIPCDYIATEYEMRAGNNWNDAAAGVKSTAKEYIFNREDLTHETSRTYEMFAAVRPINKAGDRGIKAYSSLYSAPKAGSAVDIPVGSLPHINTLSPDGKAEIGDTLAAHYTYREAGGTPEGNTTYLWKTRDTRDSITSTTVQAAKTAAEGGDKYTLTAADYGKIIECIIVPAAENGLKGNAITAKTSYGNAFLSNSASGSGYRGRAIPYNKIVAYENNGYFQDSSNSGSATAITMKINAGDIREFNSFYIKTKSTAFSDISLSWSEDDVNYYKAAELETTTMRASSEYVVNIKKVENPDGTIVDFPGIASAQYFKFTGYKTGYAYLTNFYAYISADATPKIVLDAENVTVVKGAPVTNMDGVTGFDAYGNDVTGTIEISGSLDSNVLGEQRINYTLDVGGNFPVVRASKVFNVVAGVQTEGDVAFGATTNVPSVVDGNEYTTWTGTGTSADITLDFGTEKGFSSVVIDEEGSNIESVTVCSSDNGSDWTTLVTDAALDADGMVSFTAVEAKYAKITLKYSSAPTVKDIEISTSEDAKIALAKENLDLDISLTNVKADIALPTVGEYGTTIEWSSSNTDAISNTGIVTRGSESQTVTLTATISIEGGTPVTKEFTVTVAAKEKQKESSSGGGGGFFKTPELSQIPVVDTETKAYDNYEKFVDVTNDHWAATYINQLAEEGIISGKASNSYQPEANITRAEYLKLLIESLGVTAEDAVADFADVSKDAWYYKYVAIANSLGIAEGANGYFSPDAPILRRDMAVLAQRAIKAIDGTLASESEAKLVDLNSVADYAKDAVVLLAQAGIINGNEKGEFMPDNYANRAQTAKIIYMLKVSVKGAE